MSCYPLFVFMFIADKASNSTTLMYHTTRLAGRTVSRIRSTNLVHDRCEIKPKSSLLQDMMMSL